ncbi:type II toxin-antitoxin system HicA family toxin [Candidatus Azambacteria bacterium]|nr:type II toxin-antitoxin system HicA family toxin [Candidatus Azambacteria bacterium]
MPKLKILSGQEIIKIFIGFDFSMAAQKGSHIKLIRILGGTRQTLTIPNHSELDKGTIKAIYRQALVYVSESEIRPYFYSE